VVIGGTVAIVSFLTVTPGALVAVLGYTDFLRKSGGGPACICVVFVNFPVDSRGDAPLSPWPPPSVRAPPHNSAAMRINDESTRLR